MTPGETFLQIMESKLGKFDPAADNFGIGFDGKWDGNHHILVVGFPQYETPYGEDLSCLDRGFWYDSGALFGVKAYPTSKPRHAAKMVRHTLIAIDQAIAASFPDGVPDDMVYPYVEDGLTARFWQRGVTFTGPVPTLNSIKEAIAA